MQPRRGASGVRGATAASVLLVLLAVAVASAADTPHQPRTRIEARWCPEREGPGETPVTCERPELCPEARLLWTGGDGDPGEPRRVAVCGDGGGGLVCCLPPPAVVRAPTKRFVQQAGELAAVGDVTNDLRGLGKSTPANPLSLSYSQPRPQPGPRAWPAWETPWGGQAVVEHPRPPAHPRQRQEEAWSGAGRPTAAAAAPPAGPPQFFMGGGISEEGGWASPQWPTAFTEAGVWRSAGPRPWGPHPHHGHGPLQGRPPAGPDHHYQRMPNPQRTRADGYYDATAAWQGERQPQQAQRLGQGGQGLGYQHGGGAQAAADGYPGYWRPQGGFQPPRQPQLYAGYQQRRDGAYPQPQAPGASPAHRGALGGDVGGDDHQHDSQMGQQHYAVLHEPQRQEQPASGYTYGPPPPPPPKQYEDQGFRALVYPEPPGQEAPAPQAQPQAQPQPEYHQHDRPEQDHHQQNHPQQENYQQGHAQQENYQQGHPQQENYQQSHPQQENYQQGHPQQENYQQGHPQQENYQQGHPQQEYPLQEHRQDTLQQENLKQDHRQPEPLQEHYQQEPLQQEHPQQDFYQQHHPQQENPQQNFQPQDYTQQKYPQQDYYQQHHAQQEHAPQEPTQQHQPQQEFLQQEQPPRSSDDENVIPHRPDVHDSQMSPLYETATTPPTPPPPPPPTAPGQRSRRMCERYAAASRRQIHASSLLLGEEAEAPVRKELAGCANHVPLVVGGQNASEDEFPHMAAIGFLSGSELGWLCGGSLVSERFVLTAAHCTHTAWGRPALVRLGSPLLPAAGAAPDDSGATTVAVQAVVPHPQYAPPARYHDIALLRLARALPLTARVRPACLPPPRQDDDGVQEPPTDSLAVATGWGRLSHAGDTSDVLQKVALRVWDWRACQSVYPPDGGGPGARRRQRLGAGLGPGMLCAGDPDSNRDTCQGDSGGPLQVTLPGDACTLQVLGITSFGRECGLGLPAVYTRVAAYVSWIEDQVWPEDQRQQQQQQPQQEQPRQQQPLQQQPLQQQPLQEQPLQQQPLQQQRLLL